MLRAAFRLLPALALSAACGSDSPSPANTDLRDVADDAGDADGTDARRPDVGDAGADAATNDTSADADADVDARPTTHAVRGVTRDGDELTPSFAWRQPGSPVGRVWLTLTVGDDAYEIAADEPAESFVFPVALDTGDAFTLHVSGHPRDRYCTVAPPEGVVADGDVEVVVDCVPGFPFPTSLTTNDGDEVRAERGAYQRDGDVFTYTFAWVTGAVDYVPWNPNPTTSGGSVTRTHVDGRLLERVSYRGAGDDRRPDTDDDPISARYVYVYDGGDLERVLHTVGPGDDADWFTDDDTLGPSTRRVERRTDGEGRVTCRISYGPGADGVLDTDDDLYIGGIRVAYGRNDAVAIPERVVEQIRALGADALPCTEDDEVIAGAPVWESDDGRRRIELREHEDLYDEHVFDPLGYPLSTVTWRAATNGVLGGPDVDRIVAVTDYDGLGDDPDTPREIIAPFSGDDGAWHTDDDIYVIVDPANVRDEAGRVIRRVVYPSGGATSHNGDDRTWATDDDTAETVTFTRYAGEYADCVAVHEGSGDNGRWDNTDCGAEETDDAIRTLTWQEPDDQGRQGLRCTYDGPGDDGVWRTEDDTIQPSAGDGFVWEFGCTMYEHVSDTLRVVIPIHEGHDGVYFTEDDEQPNARLEVLDSDGQVVRHVYTTGSDSADQARGPDGVWYTEDDQARSYEDRRVDRAGNLRFESRVEDYGPDEYWFTEDDVIAQQATYVMAPRFSFLTSPVP